MSNATSVPTKLQRCSFFLVIQEIIFKRDDDNLEDDDDAAVSLRASDDDDDCLEGAEESVYVDTATDADAGTDTDGASDDVEFILNGTLDNGDDCTKASSFC